MILKTDLLLQLEFHSGKVTACELLSVGDRIAAVTCSDNGDVMVSELFYSPGSTSLSRRKTASPPITHISSIKCLSHTPSKCSLNSTLLFTGGGRAQLTVSALTAGRYHSLCMFS